MALVVECCLVLRLGAVHADDLPDGGGGDVHRRAGAADAVQVHDGRVRPSAPLLLHGLELLRFSAVHPLGHPQRRLQSRLRPGENQEQVNFKVISSTLGPDQSGWYKRLDDQTGGVQFILSMPTVLWKQPNPMMLSCSAALRWLVPCFKSLSLSRITTFSFHVKLVRFVGAILREWNTITHVCKQMWL